MYSIKEAAARSGVTIPTLRAWERRYGVVSPTRTPGGYRLYDDEAIRRLRLMRRLLDDGWRPREAAAEVAAERAVDPGLPRDRDRQASAAPAEANSLVGRFVDAVSPFDSAALESALEEAFARSRFESAMEAVVFPALREVGRRWETGQISVAAEHAASHHVLRRLALMFEAAAQPATAHQVVIGLPPGARHDLGALAFAVAARRIGIGVLYIGADVPLESWLKALEATGAPAATIAVPTSADAAAAADVVRAGRRSLPSVAWFVGGAGADDAALTGIDAVRLPDGIGQSSRRLRQHLS